MLAITQHSYGGPSVLLPAEVAEPPLGAFDVRVDVKASVVTQGDRRLRAGDFPGVTWLPGRLVLGLTGPRRLVPGSMWAGRVAAVGPSVTRFAAGDDVFGAGLGGAWAERLVAAEGSAIARVPQGFSYAEAAATPYGAGTAAAFLDRADLRAGERLLVLGAAGGVGRFVVQLALRRGALVTAVARPAHRERLRALGVEDVRSLEEVDGTWDVVFDAPGLWSTADAARRLGPDGRFVTLLVSVGTLARMVFRPLLGGPRVITGAAMDNAASLENLRVLAEQGAFRPVIGRRFALADAAAAHLHLEQDRPDADVVLER